MFACVPLAFALSLDAGAIDEEVQRTLGAVIRQAHVQRFLTTAQGAEVRGHPIQPSQPQKTLNKPSRLPKRHPKQHFHRQTDLDCGITETLLSAAMAAWARRPCHRRIKPDRK